MMSWILNPWQTGKLCGPEISCAKANYRSLLCLRDELSKPAARKSLVALEQD